MAKPLLDDVTWHHVQEVLPPRKPRRSRCPGRKPIDDRRTLTGILFVLKVGIPWEELPRELGCGSGMTCWRRLRHWHQAGLWHRIKAVVESQCADAHRINWGRAARDGRARRLAAATLWDRHDGPGGVDGGTEHRPAADIPALQPVGPVTLGGGFDEAGLMETFHQPSPSPFVHSYPGADPADAVNTPVVAEDRQKRPALV